MTNQYDQVHLSYISPVIALTEKESPSFSAEIIQRWMVLYFLDILGNETVCES